VVIPVYNEERWLAEVVRRVRAVPVPKEILLVDDGSTDGTGRIADELANKYPQVHVLHHARNLGFVTAYGTALAQARMSYFTFVPGDHEVTPESVRNIFAEVGAADLVVPYHATPWRRGWFRRLLTWVCTTEVNILFGWRLRYYQGPVVYPTALARALPRTARGFFFATEMLVHALDAGYSFKEVGLAHQDRAYGRSKAVALSNIIDAERTILRLWWNIRLLRRRVVPRPAPGVVRDNVLEGLQL
jgi:glycosyltransferase involved in cell wall biosynthesis